jgi:Family of unknown function (DUF6496)
MQGWISVHQAMSSRTRALHAQISNIQISNIAEKPLKGEMMAAKRKSANRKVKRAMHEMKRGKLKSGTSGKTVKSRKQAIAIGLSEARKAGAKVPKKKRSTGRK